MNKTDMIYDIVNRTESKVDSIDKRVTSLEIDTAKNTETLIDHTRRSLANEARLVLLEDRNTLKHKAKFFMAIVSGVGAFAGTIYTISKLI